jgi:Predicted nucleotide-binding protein containing TIR-like domain
MLRVSSPIVEAQLARSIEQGQALLLRASLIIDFSDHERWKAARQEWIERTDETLDRIYEGPQEVDEFESAAYAPAVGQPWQIEYNDSNSLRTAVEVLISLQDRLDDYAPGDLAEAAPAPDFDRQPGQESGDRDQPWGLPRGDPETEEESGDSVDADLAPTSSSDVEFVQPMATAAGSSLPTPPAGRARTDRTRQVFLVHGRDEKLKDAVSALLERAGPHPVTILNERPSDRKMLVEHPEERTADSRYAVILLTADDIAGPRLDSGREPHFSTRARQGVVFEMGVLVAALTPRCLCVLYEDGVERPCDIDGITYVLLDLAGTWRSKLLLHLRGAGFDYDLNTLAPI